MPELFIAAVTDLDAGNWQLLSVAVGEFEAAWKQSPRPDLASFVPAVADPLRRRFLIELIKVDQEYRWQAGERQLTEAYLGDWPELAAQDDVVVELLTAECLTRAILDATPTAEELHSRYPHLAARLDLEQIESEARSERDGRSIDAEASTRIMPGPCTTRPTPAWSHDAMPRNFLTTTRRADSATTNCWKKSPAAAWGWSTRPGRLRSTASSR